MLEGQENEVEATVTGDWRALLPKTPNKAVRARRRASVKPCGPQNGAVEGPEATVGACVSQLEALFLKLDADLSFVSRRLDLEFATQYADAGADKLNPKKMVRRLEKLKRSIATLKELSAAVIEAKTTRLPAIQAVLTANLEGIRRLQAAVSFEACEAPPDMAVLSSWLAGAGAGAGAPALGSLAGAPAEPASAAESGDQSSGEVLAEEGARSYDFPCQPMRSGACFLEVSHDEFMSVSDLVRGRSKLKDVNKVYKALFDHFDSKKKRKPLDAKAMSRMGLSVAGSTGEAKLKVLRALGILKMGKAGVHIVK